MLNIWNNSFACPPSFYINIKFNVMSLHWWLDTLKSRKIMVVPALLVEDHARCKSSSDSEYEDLQSRHSSRDKFTDLTWPVIYRLVPFLERIAIQDYNTSKLQELAAVCSKWKFKRLQSFAAISARLPIVFRPHIASDHLRGRHQVHLCSPRPYYPLLSTIEIDS